jgi:hypothetical protein
LEVVLQDGRFDRRRWGIMLGCRRGTCTYLDGYRERGSGLTAEDVKGLGVRAESSGSTDFGKLQAGIGYG